MFKFLKEKISGWFKGKEEETTEEKIVSKEKKSAISTEEKKSSKKTRAKEIKKKEKKNKKEIFEEQYSIEKKEKAPEIEPIENLDQKEKIKEDKQESEEKVLEKENFFSKLIKKISTSALTEDDFEELFMEFELSLLENNVALEVVDKIKETLKKELLRKTFRKGEAEKEIFGALKKSIDAVLLEPTDLFELIKNKEGIFVILFFGINGSGKTTSIAKLAYKLKKEGLSCVLAAADTFRAASIEQLEEHSKKIGVPLIKKDYQSDPASVGFEAIQYAKKNKIKVVLIDTAGRMYTRANLMKEMEKIVRVCKPDLKIFVGESITGNDALEQAKAFNESVGIDGIILSKADVDEKAGTIISVSYVTGKPIYFLGVGQEYDDLEVFSKKNIFKNLGLN